RHKGDFKPGAKTIEKNYAIKNCSLQEKNRLLTKKIDIFFSRAPPRRPLERFFSLNFPPPVRIP
ncbi:MAG: hypothetical protein LBE01_06200, partial [Deltaproteobacteria bacterium]|nr:hypothetical protein [Deltaproteobacteria bacterium]